MASHLDLEEQEQLEQLKAFWKRWGNLITWLLTLGLLAFAGWNGWTMWQRSQATQAGAMFAELERAVQAGDLDKGQKVLADLKERFGRTAYAAQGGLLGAKLQLDQGKAEEARATLAWVAKDGSEASYRDLALLRLAALQMDAKQYDEASKSLDGVKGADFAALVADRRGDLALLQNKPDQARAEFKKAYEAMDKTLDYRRLVAVKLGSLGVSVEEEKGAQR